MDHGLILAGSAAGILFAIEEMGRSFEQRTNGTLITAVAPGQLQLLRHQHGQLTPTQTRVPIFVRGIAGGIFAPSLAAGAGFGASLASWLPDYPVGVVVIQGMVGYFTGVVQTPINGLRDRHGND